MPMLWIWNKQFVAPFLSPLPVAEGRNWHVTWHSHSANAPTLWQQCHNVGGNVVSTLVPTLWQYSFVDTFKHPSNTVWTSKQHCVNIVPVLYFNQNPNIAITLANVSQHWDNVEAKLCECCGNVALNIGDRCSDNVWAMLCECHGNVALNVGHQPSDNVQAIFGEHWCPMLGTKVETMFRQGWVNVV